MEGLDSPIILPLPLSLLHPQLPSSLVDRDPKPYPEEKAQKSSGLDKKRFDSSYKALSDGYQSQKASSSRASSNTSTPKSNNGKMSKGSPSSRSAGSESSPTAGGMRKKEGESMEDYAKRVQNPSLKKKQGSKFPGSGSPALRTGVSTRSNPNSPSESRSVGTSKVGPSTNPVRSPSSSSSSSNQNSPSSYRSSELRSSSNHRKEDVPEVTTRSSPISKQLTPQPSTPHRSEKRSQSSSVHRTPSSSSSKLRKDALHNSATKAQKFSDDYRAKERQSAEEEEDEEEDPVNLLASPTSLAKSHPPKKIRVDKGKKRAVSPLPDLSSKKPRVRERYAFPIRESIGISKNELPEENHGDELRVREFISKWMPNAELLFGNWKPQAELHLDRDGDGSGEGEEDEIEVDDELNEVIQSSDDEERRQLEGTVSDDDEEEDSEDDEINLLPSPLKVKPQQLNLKAKKNNLSSSARAQSQRRAVKAPKATILKHASGGLTIKSDSGSNRFEMKESKVKKKGEDFVLLKLERISRKDRGS